MILLVILRQNFNEIFGMVVEFVDMGA